jgi:hypothetical protein
MDPSLATSLAYICSRGSRGEKWQKSSFPMPPIRIACVIVFHSVYLVSCAGTQATKLLQATPVFTKLSTSIRSQSWQEAHSYASCVDIDYETLLGSSGDAGSHQFEQVSEEHPFACPRAPRCLCHSRDVGQQANCVEVYASP